ncbi:hypothetical protein [Flavobacterium cerinum]|uniref:Carboxypeptidase-like regulatory domain-containing protein n=1 Tax=Flavobacterium cerinum TaxID=2502784 RepID=A0ABY5IVL6_9FLAO|nr:hypothetical protein [Flavobacterium cerinum]UUC45798.1 hypothetical protein NOX80_00995 [Flavobacterium cerinum]
MKHLLLFFLLMCNALLLAQNDKELKGRLIADNNGDVESISIANLTTEKQALSGKDGTFKIVAAVGDVLQFSSIQYGEKKMTLKEIDFGEEELVVKMVAKVNQLSEVYIGKGTITSESLGLVSPGQKKYTPAERKLKTAGDFKPIHLLNILGGALPFDPIINKISGKTKRLKKELDIEGRELMMDRLKGWFEESYLVNDLKIPAENSDGFWMYTMDDAGFTNAVKAKNKTLATFLLTELAVKYKKIISE